VDLEFITSAHMHHICTCNSVYQRPVFEDSAHAMSVSNIRFKLLATFRILILNNGHENLIQLYTSGGNVSVNVRSSIPRDLSSDCLQVVAY